MSDPSKCAHCGKVTAYGRGKLVIIGKLHDGEHSHDFCCPRILDRLATLAEIEGKTIIDMLPDIRIIKENQLWKLGGYGSFNEFCGRALGVSRQYVYRVLSVNQDARKVLEINGENGEKPAKLTSGVLDALLLEGLKEPPNPSAPTEEKPPEKSLNNPQRPAPKGRKPRPDPEPIEATFTEPEVPSVAAKLLGPAFKPMPPTPTPEDTNDRAWLVVSTAVGTGAIMLQCLNTHATAVVRDYSKEEWGAAFYAPSKPYYWEDESRVVDISECVCPHCGGAI